MNGKMTSCAETDSTARAKSKPVMEVPDRANLGMINTLPDSLLCHIGTTVLGLCGADSFVQLARTSKHIHRTLMDKDFISSTLESQNEWISAAFKAENENYFKHAFSTNTILISNEQIATMLESDYEQNLLFDPNEELSRCPDHILSSLDSENNRISNHMHNYGISNANPSVTSARSIEELSLCQDVVEARKSIGLTIIPGVPFNGYYYFDCEFDRDRYERQLKFIAATLMKYRSAVLIVDIYDNLLEYPCIEMPFTHDLNSISYQIFDGWHSFDMQRRCRVRRRQLLDTSELNDKLDNYPCFFEFGFRLGGIEAPPLRSFQRETIRDQAMYGAFWPLVPTRTTGRPFPFKSRYPTVKKQLEGMNPFKNICVVRKESIKKTTQLLESIGVHYWRSQNWRANASVAQMNLGYIILRTFLVLNLEQ